MNAIPLLLPPDPLSKGEGAWQLAAATVRGRDHGLSLRNNQDGLAVRRGAVAVAVVTDGCSSGASNEAGARLGAEVLANAVLSLAPHGLDAQLAARATDRLFAWLYESARALAPDGSGLAAVVERFFLFSFLCAVTAGDRALVFGLGDGVWAVDGALRVLDPGPDNAPPYLGYRALPHAAVTSALASEPVVHFLGPARTLLIATDGLSGALSHEPGLPAAWASDPRVFSNPAQLGRQLNVLAEQKKWLRDDTTVALLERA